MGRRPEAPVKSDRIDFIPLHWYGPPDKVQDFLTFVDRVHNDPAFGGRPIWVTEFSVRCQGSYTLNPNTCGVQHVIDFINTALAGLEARNYVERYSWFAGEGNDPDWFSTARLFDLTTGQLTEVGKAYRDFRTVATFSPGDRVKTTAILNVRATPSGSGTRVGTVPLGSLGTIVGGPTNTANYTFWQIDWDSSISGWSVERYLAKTSTSTDTTLPTVSLTAPAASSTVSSTVTLSANASDNVGVTGVQFKVDGANVGAEDTTAPYSRAWNSTTATNGAHTIKAVAKDAAGNTASTAGRSVTVSNNVV